MTQRLQRPHQPANAGVTSTTLNRLGKAAIAAAMTVVEGLLGTNSDTGARLARAIIGDAFRIVATGTTPSVNVERGLAYMRDDSIADVEWNGEVRPLWLEEDIAIAMPTNSDPSGHPRIDVIAVRPITVNADEEDVKVKVSADGPITVETHSLSRVCSIEFRIFPGVAAVTPQWPAIPTGWFILAAVTRPNGVANVSQDQIRDRRFEGGYANVRSNTIEAFNKLVLGRERDTLYSAIQRMEVQEDFHEAGDIVFYDQTYDDQQPSGRVHFKTVAVWGDLVLEELSGALKKFVNLAGERAAFDSKVTPIAYGTLVYDQPNDRFNVVNGYNLPAFIPNVSTGRYTYTYPDAGMFSGDDVTIVANATYPFGYATRQATVTANTNGFTIAVRDSSDAYATPDSGGSGRIGSVMIAIFDANKA